MATAFLDIQEAFAIPRLERYRSQVARWADACAPSLDPHCKANGFSGKVSGLCRFLQSVRSLYCDLGSEVDGKVTAALRALDMRRRGTTPKCHRGRKIKALSLFGVVHNFEVRQPRSVTVEGPKM